MKKRIVFSDLIVVEEEDTAGSILGEVITRLSEIKASLSKEVTPPQLRAVQLANDTGFDGKTVEILFEAEVNTDDA